MIRNRKSVLRHIISNQHLYRDEQSFLQIELSRITHDFLGGRPPTEAEGVGYPSCSSFLCALCLRGDSDNRSGAFKIDTKTQFLCIFCY